MRGKASRLGATAQALETVGGSLDELRVAQAATWGGAGGTGRSAVTVSEGIPA